MVVIDRFHCTAVVQTDSAVMWVIRKENLLVRFLPHGHDDDGFWKCRLLNIGISGGLSTQDMLILWLCDATAESYFPKSCILHALYWIAALSVFIQKQDTPKPEQNGKLYADEIFQCVFMNGNLWIFTKKITGYFLGDDISRVLGMEMCISIQFSLNSFFWNSFDKYVNIKTPGHLHP